MYYTYLLMTVNYSRYPGVLDSVASNGPDFNNRCICDLDVQYRGVEIGKQINCSFIFKTLCKPINLYK